MLADNPLPGLRCSAANRGPKFKIHQPLVVTEAKAITCAEVL